MVLLPSSRFGSSFLVHLVLLWESLAVCVSVTVQRQSPPEPAAGVVPATRNCCIPAHVGRKTGGREVSPLLIGRWVLSPSCPAHRYIQWDLHSLRLLVHSLNTVCLFVLFCLFIRLFVCLFVCLFCLFVCLFCFVCLFVCLFTSAVLAVWWTWPEMATSSDQRIVRRKLYHGGSSAWC